MEGSERQSHSADDGHEQDCRIDEADEKENQGAGNFMRTEKLAVVGENNARQMKYVPLERDGCALTSRREGMSIRGIPDDPEIDCLNGKRQEGREFEDVQHIPSSC